METYDNGYRLTGTEVPATAVAVPIQRMSGPDQLTIGVEEEFLLVDARTRKVSARAPAVLETADGRAFGLQPEITQFQVETCTPVCHTVPELREHLTKSRAVLNTAAREHGVRLVASGTSVLSGAIPPPLTDKPRYQQMADQYGALADGLSICGCHVHLGVPDPEQAVRISNHLRPWLPLLLAISANSPFWDGRDTGYASWRYMVWARWPTAGPPPLFDSVAHYEATVRSMLRAGAALDHAMAYWDVRLSYHHPTIEFRVADVAATVEEAVLLAALIRALAATALAGRLPAPPVSQQTLRAAMWRAARDGLEGAGVDPVTGQVLPTAVLVTELVDRLLPALDDSGDLELVSKITAELLTKGSGALRQRHAHARRGKLTDVVDLLTAQTAGAATLV